MAEMQEPEGVFVLQLEGQPQLEEMPEEEFKSTSKEADEEERRISASLEKAAKPELDEEAPQSPKEEEAAARKMRVLALGKGHKTTPFLPARAAANAGSQSLHEMASSPKIPGEKPNSSASQSLKDKIKSLDAKVQHERAASRTMK